MSFEHITLAGELIVIPFPFLTGEVNNTHQLFITAGEYEMPFYSTETIENVQLSTGNPGEYKPLAGEFMKAGVVTYRKGTGSKPHWRNNEEQYVYIIEGKRYMRLGDEEKIIGPGDIIHIPRGTLHGGRTLNEKAVMFVAKSPAEDPDLGADHHYPDDLQEIIAHLDAKAEELYGTV